MQLFISLLVIKIPHIKSTNYMQFYFVIINYNKYKS